MLGGIEPLGLTDVVLGDFGVFVGAGDDRGSASLLRRGLDQFLVADHVGVELDFDPFALSLAAADARRQHPVEPPQHALAGPETAGRKSGRLPPGVGIRR